MKTFLRSLSVAVGLGILFFLSSVNYVQAIPPDLKALRERILAEKEPVSFLFIKEFNPWHNGAYMKFFDGEVHRILHHYAPPPETFEADILQRLNDPRARHFFILRQYMTVLRRLALPKKPSSDPYAKLRPNSPAYLLISKAIAETGPMTQINVANLILPELWVGKNYMDARRSDGELVYAYILLNDAAQRTLEDLFRDERLLGGFVEHLGMRLMEGETRGQKRGLDAHLNAHTGPWTNLGYSTTWCQNRGYYESWALAHRTLLSQLFPDVFPPFRARELLERDAFLYFSPDPWRDAFGPFVREQRGWNTPQAVLRSNHVNALFQIQVWNDSRIENAHRKSVEILASQGSNNLREFVEDWINLFPEDQIPLSENLFEVTHQLTRGTKEKGRGTTVQEKYFPCMGPDLWISQTLKFERYDQMNLNGASLAEMKTVLNRLAGNITKNSRQAWFHHPGSQGEDVNLVDQLSEEIFSERAKRCGQFQNMGEIFLYINDFGQKHGLDLGARLQFIWNVLKAKWKNEKVYRKEKKSLTSIGAYRPERGPNPAYTYPR